MTVSHGAAGLDTRRTADPPSETLISAAVLGGAFLISIVVNAITSWALSIVGGWFTAAVVLSTLLYFGLAALIVGWRARTAQRRSYALLAVAAAATASLIPSLIWGTGYSFEVYDRFRIAFAVLGIISTLGVVLAWGLARRHGRVWPVGLVTGFVILAGYFAWFPTLVGNVPTWLLGLISMILGFAQPVFIGALCWGLDVLTTKPTPAMPGQPFAAGQPPAWTP
ncbi:MAG: hypothetical protein V9G04_02755 [Nocardioides sp.]|jgi:hypothetical protein